MCRYFPVLKCFLKSESQQLGNAHCTSLWISMVLISSYDRIAPVWTPLCTERHVWNSSHHGFCDFRVCNSQAIVKWDGKLEFTWLKIPSVITALRKKARVTQEPISFSKKMLPYSFKGKGAEVYLSSCQKSGKTLWSLWFHRALVWCLAKLRGPAYSMGKIFI